MKLGKLLGAGKSFISGHAEGAYRENKHVYLPKFGPAKNPFTPKEPGAAPAAPVPAPVKPANPLPAPVAARSPGSEVRPGAKPVRAASWKDKLNPFRPVQPAAPLLPAAVQPELSLDTVKVVHNDLSDAEVEVVPVKSRPAAPAGVPMLPPPREPWEFLGERLINPV